MPEVLEETERERRLREKEEALLAAQQAAQIQDAITIGPPVMPPEAAQWVTPVNTFTSPDLEALRQVNPSAAAQYDAQVAQAQRNNGFINAEVNFEGRVLSPMISPELSPQAAALAEMRARQFTGQQRYRQGIKDGLTPEESYRGAAFDLHAGNPNAFARGLRDIGAGRSRINLDPEVTNVDGVKMYRTGPNSFAQARPEVPVKPPPETVAGQKILTGQITDARNVLERAEKAVADDRTDVNAVNAALRARSKLRGLEEKFMQGSTNWMERAAVRTLGPDVNASPVSAQAPVRPIITEQIPGGGFRIGWANPQMPSETAAAPAPAPATAQETVVVVKDGRRYSLPKSQLEEALKAGYKQGQ